MNILKVGINPFTKRGIQAIQSTNLLLVPISFLYCFFTKTQFISGISRKATSLGLKFNSQSSLLLFYPQVGIEQFQKFLAFNTGNCPYPICSPSLNMAAAGYRDMSTKFKFQPINKNLISVSYGYAKPMIRRFCLKFSSWFIDGYVNSTFAIEKTS